MKYKIWLTILIVLGVNESFSQNIASIRARSTGSIVTARGIVSNGSEFGTTRYFQDASAGIAAVGNRVSNFFPGDSVEVTGTLRLNNGLLEINPVSSAKILGRGKTLLPIKTTFSDGFSEKYEGMLMAFEGVTFSASGTFSGGTNYNVSQNGKAAELRVNSGTNIVGTSIPPGRASVVGVMSQFGFTPTTGYQVLPRTWKDIQADMGPVVVEPLEASDIQTNSLEISFETLNNGSSLLYWGLNSSTLNGPVVATNMTKTHKLRITGLQPATVYYVLAAAVNANGDTSFSSPAPFITRSLSSGDIEAYFTRAVDNSVAQFNNANYVNRAIDDTLIAYINRATESIDIAIYNWNNSGLSDISTALNNAFNRGVKIRVITDGGTATLGLNTLNNQVPRLESPTTSAYTIMHNKFVIFDCDAADPLLPILWTGSTNWTNNQINLDPNDVILFQDQSICKVFKMEFEEMWGGSGMSPQTANSRFGSFKSDNTPHQLNIGGKAVEVYFSPSDNTEDHLLDLIASADSDIEVGTNLMTRSSISNSIIANVQARSLFGAVVIGDISIGGPYNALRNTPQMTGQVKHWNQQGLFHHKYCIIDQNDPGSDPTLWTGSHNWSNAANTMNDENTVVVHDFDIVNQYFQSWLNNYKILGGRNWVTSANQLKGSELRMYPNPVTERLFLISEVIPSSIDIYNVEGRMLMSLKNTKDVNVSALEKGIYVADVLRADGQRQILRFIKI